MNEKTYALYKGGNILSVGTIKEIANELNMSVETLMFYGTDSYKKQLALRKRSKNARLLVQLEDEEKWFFSYSYSIGEHIDFDSCMFKLNRSITDMKDLYVIEEKIRNKRKYDKVTILYYRKF
jgi:hypothetical protein